MVASVVRMSRGELAQAGIDARRRRRARAARGRRPTRRSSGRRCINLMRNAREAMADGGDAARSTSRCAAGAASGIADRHPRLGRRASARRTSGKIFDPFFSTKERGHRAGAGAGAADRRRSRRPDRGRRARRAPGRRSRSTLPDAARRAAEVSACRRCRRRRRGGRRPGCGRRACRRGWRARGAAGQGTAGRRRGRVRRRPRRRRSCPWRPGRGLAPRADRRSPGSMKIAIGASSMTRADRPAFASPEHHLLGHAVGLRVEAQRRLELGEPVGGRAAGSCTARPAARAARRATDRSSMARRRWASAAAARLRWISASASRTRTS